MASTAAQQNASPNSKLSPQQQRLLLAALNSNKPANPDPLTGMSVDPLAMNNMAFDPSMLADPGSANMSFDDSPFVDYDYDFDPDASFDFDFPASDTAGAQMIGALPGEGSPDADVETHDKRSHPEDEDAEEGGGKRRESEDKPPAKKPGRKPLTTEPTSKRKAQNRAAQRAFRERKEKHLRDLETKVQDLEKASETANHENSILRAQIEKMTIELREYKKRLSTRLSMSGAARAPGVNQQNSQAFANGLINSPNDISFQFEFPRFGRLPGPPVLANKPKEKSAPAVSATVDKSQSPAASKSPLSGSAPSVNGTSNAAGSENYDMSFSSLFTPPQDSTNGDVFDFMAHKGSNASATTESLLSFTSGHNTSYNSPSASSNSNSNGGPSSSAGTSPEPSTQSPSGGKPLDNTLGTIGEESSYKSQASGIANPTVDVNGLEWLAQQNGNQFDPQLFGDYRDPQDQFALGNLDESFFTDAFAVPDFTTPYNIPASPAAPKKDLLTQIDEKQADDEEVPGEDPTKLLNCTKIWDRLQTCPKVQTGEFDLDGLCSELRSKAKCSETGAVVDERDFSDIMAQFGSTKQHAA